MKLRISNILRTALLTCFAAMSSFTTSLATGTIAAGIVTCIISQQQANAQTVTTYNGGDGAPQLSALGGVDDSIIMDLNDSYIAPDGGTTSATVYVKNWSFGGFSQRTYVFNNSIIDFNLYTGDGKDPAAAVSNIGTTARGDTNAVGRDYFVTYRFGGAMSQFSGGIISKGSALSLEFFQGDVATQEARNASASGSGDIIIGGRTVTYNLAGTVTVNNTSITVSNTIDGAAVAVPGTNFPLNPLLTFSGAAVYNISSTITADLLTVSAGTTSNFNGAVTSTNTQSILGTANFAGTGSNLTGNLSIAADASMSIAAGATMTMNGTLTALSVISNAGTVSFGENFVINLSALTPVGDTYTIFANTGAGTLTGFEALTADNIDDAFVSAGKNIVFNADGTITIETAGTLHTFAGGTLDWQVGSTFEGGTLFADDDSVVFSGDSDVTITGPIAAALVTVEAGSILTLSNDGTEANQLSGTIFVDGTLVLKNDILSDNSQISSTDAAAAGTVRFDIGAGNTLDYETQLDNFTGAVVVESGTMLIDTEATSGNATYSLEIEAGASLSVQNTSLPTMPISLNGSEDSSNRASLLIANSTLTGGLNLSGYTSVTSTALFNVAGPLDIEGEVNWEMGAINGISGAMTGSGTLNKLGTGTTLVSGSLANFSGSINVQEGILQVGTGGGNELNPANLSSITVGAGAQFSLFHDETNMSNTDVIMNGGLFHNQGMSTNADLANLSNLNSYTTFASLTATGDNTFRFYYKGRYYFDTLSGEGTITFSNQEGDDIGVTEPRVFYFGTVGDFHGTITNNYADAIVERLIIDRVEQSAGIITTVTAQDVYSEKGFTMAGEGTFNINQSLNASSVTLNHTGTLTVTNTVSTSSFKASNAGTTNIGTLSILNNGSLHMNYEGTLNITNLSLASNTILHYDHSTNLLNIDASNITGLNQLTLSILDLDRATLAGGIDLGLASDILDTNINVFGLTEDQYTLTIDNITDRWILTVGAEEVFDFGGWDTDWGIDVILEAPDMADIVATDSITASTALALPIGTSIYLVAGTDDIAVNLTGGGGAAVFIYGGTNSATTQVTVTADVWINMTGGTFRALVGGNLADNWGGGTVCNFVGDTHIQVSGGTVDHIIGGNYKDGQSPTFTGDTYITIDDGAVIKGSIFGASTVTHSSTTNFNGSTNIFVNTVLSDTTGAQLHGEGTLNSIIGGNSWLTNVNGALNLTGNTNVTVDLSGSTSIETIFEKRIIGGSYVSNTSSSTITGDSHVTITGKDGVTFDTTNNVGIMGSYFSNSGNTSHHYGASHVTINGNGSTFADRVAGGAEHVGGTGSVTGGSYLTIHSGTFSSHVMGGSNMHAGTFTTGGTNLTITDGTFNGFVFGGSVHAAGTYTNTAGTELNISGGTFANNVFGGSINVNNASTNITQGKINMQLTGGTFNTYIAGGSSIDAAFTGTASVAGGVEIIIDGAAEMKGNIIGGHVRIEGDTACNLSMGDVVINLAGGTVGADVHAAGFIGAAFATTTASTKVIIDNDVVFDNDASTPTIINGAFGGAGSASGTVEGDRTLSFSAADAYNNLDNVTFQNFDVVDVAEATATVGITLDALELTKTGAGTLELASANRDLVTVEAGTLKLGAGAGSITELNVRDTGTLDLTNGSVGTITDLTLNGLSGLTANNSGVGQALGSLTLTGVNATNKVTLDLGTLNSTFDITLFTGLSEATIDGITFETTGSFTNTNALDYFDIAGLGAGATAFLVLDDDGTLRLVNSLVAEMTWGGGSGSISDANWVVEGAVNQNFANELSYTFDTAETANISIDVAVKAATFNVTGENVVYNFTETATGSLVTTALSVTGGATASFVMANLDLTGSSVTIGDNSTLILEQDQTILRLNSSGTLEATGSAITLNQLTTSGGTVSAGSLNLANGANSFAQLTITGDVNSAGSLTVGGTSSLGGLTGDGSLNVTGTASSLTVGDADATRLAGFSNEGSVTFTGNLTVQTQITDGGTLSVADLTLSGGAQFDQLTATNVRNTAGTLSLGGTSSMTSLTGSAGLEVLAGGNVTITNATTLASLSNAGELEVNAALSILGSMTTGGTLSVTDLTLSADASGEHSFTKLTVTGNVLGHDGKLTLGGGSSITGNLSGGALVTTGNVSIGSNTAGMRSLNNAGTLTMGGNLVVGNDGLVNTGTLDVTGTATLFIATDQGGVLKATGDVTLAGASNTFTSINTDGVIQGTDTLIVSESSSAETLYKSAAGAGVEQLDMALQFTDVAANMTLSTTEDVRLSSVTGGGSLSVANSSNLVLGAASNMNNLTLGTGSGATTSSLTLGGSLTLAGQLSTTENLNLTVDFSPTGGNAALSVGSTEPNTLSSIKVSITTEHLDNMGMGNNSTYTLASLGAGYATDVTVSFEGLQTSLVSGANTYTISYDSVTDTVVITTIVKGNTWEGGTGATWDNSTVANWTDGTMPSGATEAFFFDNIDITQNIIVAGAKQVANLEVSTDSAFTFSGDSITAQDLRVTKGTMNIGNEISVIGGAQFATGTTLVSTGAGIDITTGGSLSTMMLDIRQNAELFDGTIAGMRLDINSSLTVEEGSIAQSAIQNAGTITLNGDAADGIYEHDMSSIVGMEIGVAGSDIMGNLVLGEQAEVSIDVLEQGNLTIGNFATLQINNNAIITGNINNVGYIDATAASVTVGGSVTAGGNMNVMDLTVNGSGATFGDIAFDNLTITSALTADNTMAYLNAENVDTLNNTSFILTLDGMRNDLEVGNYTLVSSNSTSLNWDKVVLEANTADTLTELIYNGYDVVYSDENGTLSFEVTEATERRWMVSNNYAATPGFVPGEMPENVITPIVTVGSEGYDADGNLVSGKLNSYNTLDTVKQIFVDVDFSLDLSELTLTAADSDGALLRNLNGSATLTLVGKGSTGALGSISLATIDSSTVNVLTGLSLDKMLVRFTENESNGNMQIGTLDALDSAIEITGGSSLTVTGTTTLDASSIVVGEGAASVLGVISTAHFETLKLTNGSSLLVEKTGIVTRATTPNATVGTLEVGDGSSHDVGEGAASAVENLIITEGGSLSAADAGHSAYGEAKITGNVTITTTGTGIVEIGSIIGDTTDADGNDVAGSDTSNTTLNGYLKLGNGVFEGSYVDGSTIETAVGGNTTLNTGAGLNVVSKGESYTFLADSGDNSIKSLNTVNSYVEVGTKDLSVLESSTMTGGTLAFSASSDEIINALDTNAAMNMLAQGSMLGTDGTTLVIKQSDTASTLDFSGIDTTQSYTIADFNLTDGSTIEDIIWEGNAFGKYIGSSIYDEDSKTLIITFNKDAYSRKVSSHNGQAGAAIINPLVFTDIQQTNAAGGYDKPNLAAVLNEMDKATGAQADTLAAAVAGASVTSLGSSALAAVDRQLQSVRNRSMNIGGNILAETENTVCRAWIAGESSFNTLESDGTAAGHEYNSLGGSLGVDIVMDTDFNLGFTVTALYGSVDTNSADSASGDLCSYNLSAYARVTHGNWNHSFVATVGMFDTSLERTVAYGDVNYKTEGDSAGLGLGLMYEMGYNIVLDDEATMAWSPVFNVSLVHASIDGYSENGTDGGLTVGDQESTYATVGIGGRFEALIGENTFNRSAVFTARAMVKFDAGQRYTDASVALNGYTTSGNVEGSEAGPVGLELGAGLNIPIGDSSGTLFMDAGFELRSQQNSVNCTAGYSISF